ncbi:hypothetical protein [Actinomadura parmotrematis]|uniref:SH3 domain-containing protein n=1 Tax=Actinomadura parmotrematis TaxID=2864039 RepID=A0ABS7FTI3_9ACTN|nr:hypothetical protein [Actinomadura parmotrematis]MBW8483718.1 hypothetical protein [Actinomadura parmotrematis]
MSYVAPWAGATLLAVALSWLGVRDVVRGAVSDQAPAPVTAPAIHSSPPASPPAGAATVPPRSPAAPGGATIAPAPRPSPRPPGRGGPAEAAPREPVNVHSYAVRGGRTALSVAPDRVWLVSAMPSPGYEVRVSQATGWLRVDFTGGERTSSVIATFHDHAPDVQVYEY